MELVTLGEKGQIVIPMKIRRAFHLEKGMRLLVKEEKDKIILKPTTMDEKHLLMLLSESSLKKVWDNPHDERWDDVF
ncbi:MAG: AbrB/MazE/SpoVT family DNA-binding domain-containing protein [Nanoarchaeota archaeon]